MVFRSHKDKSDPVKSWHRPDRLFFASGACHILAHAFLQRYPDCDFRPIYICPHQGFRGSHVVVSDGEAIFDYHGYSDHGLFMAHYFTKLRRFFPGWQADLIWIEGSLVNSGFCGPYQHRMPEQYLHDPMPRALAFIECFPKPGKVKSERAVLSNFLPAVVRG